MNIKLNDLQAQWEEVKDKALPEIHSYLDSGNYVDSIFVKRFEDSWSDYTNLKNSLMVSNGTEAYKVCLQTFEYDPSNTCVLLQNNTWASILFITKQLGFHYDFIDCDKYLQYSVEELKNWLKENRSHFNNVILVPTHILGHPCDMANIYCIALENKCNVIEDCSQAHGAEHTNGKVGQFSDIAFWSMYPAKNLGGVSESGVISTDDDEYARTIKYVINSGMSSKYVFATEGGNSRPDAISSIVLYHKLKHLDSWNRRRCEIAEIYQQHFPMNYADYCAKHVYHYYYIFVKNRSEIIKNICFPYNINYPFTLASLEKQNTEYFINSSKASKEILCLPCHPYMTNEEVEYVIQDLKEVMK
jgi:dTDP-4-amino-4,6-dideoxygalactose transaminase